MKLFLILIVFSILASVSKSDCPAGCSNHGMCVTNNNSTFCECENRYAKSDCSYLKKERKTAEGLEWGLGFIGIAGIGRIYLGFYALGIIHLIVSLFYCCGFWAWGCTRKFKGNNSKAAAQTFLICLIIMWVFFTIGMIIWWIVEGSIVAQLLQDANGVDLY